MQKYENHIIDSGKIGRFYKHVNRKMTSKSGIGAIKVNDQYITDPNLQAEEFSQFFAGKFIKDDGILPDLTIPRSADIGLNYIPFAVNSVRNKLLRLKENKAGGPDKLKPIFLQKLAPMIAQPLSWLYKQSFLMNFIPSIWKQAHIIPIFKRGDSSLVDNYRPVALTCTLCKVMESCIKDELMSYLLKHKFISRKPHGFLSKRSTCTQLLECVHDWSLSMHSRKKTDVVYIDFARAFDSVVHDKLLFKLSVYGIGNELYSWIGNFLKNRTQQVLIEQCLSKHEEVKSGVPQGLVLGPILFILFINDITQTLNNRVRCKLFADDVKLYSIVDTDMEINPLQEGLNKIFLWSQLWQLPINRVKCYVLHISNQQDARQQYTINGQCHQMSSFHERSWD